LPRESTETNGRKSPANALYFSTALATAAGAVLLEVAFYCSISSPAVLSLFLGSIVAILMSEVAILRNRISSIK